MRFIMGLSSRGASALGAQLRQRITEEWRERAAHGFHARLRLPERGELRHLQAGIAAGIDALERLEIHVHVEREAVVTGAAADADAHAPDFLPGHIDARRVLAALGADAERRAVRDERALHRGNEIAHAESRAADVDEWIDHELPGTVVGD